MLLGFFILMSIMLGMIFNNHKKRYTDSMAKKNEQRSEFLFEEFQKLGGGVKGWLNE